MSYRYERHPINKEVDLVIDGWASGIATSPYKGLANMQGVNISTENGEIMCSFARTKQSQTGTGGTLTRVNTNTVSISGITLQVGQVITILVDSGTGLSGNYYYLSTGKLYSGSLPPSDPDSVSAVTGISAGSATFSITYPLGNPIQSATEPYFDSTNTMQYRYYILDSLGQVWCHDTSTLVNWDTPVWFFVGTEGVGTTGLAVFNGWLHVANGYHRYWKLTSLLGSAFVDTEGVIGFESMASHFMLNGHQGTLYGTDGYTVTSLFPDTSLNTGAGNVQSYAQYSSTLGANLVTNGTFTGSASGWTLGGAWAYTANAVSKNADGTTTLEQSGIPFADLTGYLVTFTISNWTVGSVTPSIGVNNGTSVNVNGTYTQYIYNPSGSSTLTFTPTNTARFTIDTISAVGITTTANIIGGAAPTTGAFSPRIPALFFTAGTRPTAISAGTIYYIQWYVTRMEVFAAASGGAALDLSTGAVGKQYFNTFDPTTSTGQTLLVYTPQALILPFYETAQCMAELGNTVIIGGTSNTLYPWNQVDVTPGDLIFLPESNVTNIISVNNLGYVFTGSKGNIYITNNSSASPTISVPDYCAGIAGNPSSYVEPYFTWGGAMYLRGRVYFSILDQTATKAGNCGGIWSFVPVQNQFSGQDTGLALRLENQSSYGTYSGASNVLLPNMVQTVKGPQYWSGWYSSSTSPTYGIDYSDVIPQSATFETDLIPTGTMLQNRTFQQIEYKLSSPLINGESIAIGYRQNSTDTYTSCGTVKVETSTDLSGYFSINFESGQWVQLQVTMTPLGSALSSFCRITELRLR